MMSEFTTKLGLSHDNSTPYYPQSNGQFEVINKILKQMLQRMIGVRKRNWNLILYSALWTYQTSVRNATGFTPLQLVYGLEASLLIQCEIPSLKLTIDLLPNTSEEEASLFNLIHLDETRREAQLANEVHKRHIKAQYDKNVQPRKFFLEGDLVLLYDQEADVIGTRKFEPLWHPIYCQKSFF